jgi:5'-nucleotidase
MKNYQPKSTCAAGIVCLLLTLAASPGWSLNILVGNDDSCNAEGVNVLADALEAAGHTVAMYSPAGEQSGKSSSISTKVFSDYGISNVGFAGPTSAANRFCVRIPTDSPEEGSEDDVLTASASPRDSVLVGLAALGDNKPDLVVTGINDGQNIGSNAITSGTVGGVVAAMQQGIPAIAVSRHRFASEQGLSFAQAAALVVSVIAELQEAAIDGQPLMPAMTGLNINTPEKAPRAVVHTTLGNMTDILIGPTAKDAGVTNGFNGFVTLADILGDEELAAELENNPDATVEDFAEAGLDVQDETSMYVAGYVTITTLDGDLTATLRKRELMQVKLRDLQ